MRSSGVWFLSQGGILSSKDCLNPEHMLIYITRNQCHCYLRLRPGWADFRKNKSLFRAVTPAAHSRWRPPRARGDGCITRAAAARLSGSQQGAARPIAAWTYHAGEVRVKLQGLSRAKASARAVLAGRISNGIAKAQRRESPCCAHVAYETEVTRPPVA